jgi:hypothetical protein
MTTPTLIHIIGAALFAVAVLHTFCTSFFERLAHAKPRHAGIWHLLGEVEVVFGFWALVLMLFMFAHLGRDGAVTYIESRNFTEPMFVFAIMVVAGSRPILQGTDAIVRMLARCLPLPAPTAQYVVVLTLVPLLGSFITEPAAMTLAALMLRDGLLTSSTSTRLRYATLGVLFVNVSIGGTLTAFAAPPVLMVAATWGWDMGFMLANFGWKAALAIVINVALITLVFRRELAGVSARSAAQEEPVPIAMVAVHLCFLALIVVFAHHPAVFMGWFLFFLGFANAYPRHQNPLILKEALLVAFFLAGLVVLGGQQAWWLEPVLLSLNPHQVFYGATALTAVTDNAALTYLASLVQGLTAEFKVSIVAGAVAGGGLTLIANAPNPAGAAILRGEFEDGTIHPLYLLLGAAVPTVVAMLAFRLL